jgi:hypothetical protein
MSHGKAKKNAKVLFISAESQTINRMGVVKIRFNRVIKA